MHDSLRPADAVDAFRAARVSVRHRASLQSTPHCGSLHCLFRVVDTCSDGGYHGVYPARHLVLGDESFLVEHS
jgi:hypothetical protein